MAEAEAPSRIILDPSFLFTNEAIPWLDDPVARPSLVVSATLSEALDRSELEPFIEHWLTTTHENPLQVRHAGSRLRMEVSTTIWDSKPSRAFTQCW